MLPGCSDRDRGIGRRGTEPRAASTLVAASNRPAMANLPNCPRGHSTWLLSGPTTIGQTPGQVKLLQRVGVAGHGGNETVKLGRCPMVFGERSPLARTTLPTSPLLNCRCSHLVSNRLCSSHVRSKAFKHVSFFFRICSVPVTVAKMSVVDHGQTHSI